MSKESFNRLPLGKTNNIAFRNIKIFMHHCASLRPISLRISSERIYRATDAIEKYKRDMVTVIDNSHYYLLIWFTQFSSTKTIIIYRKNSFSNNQILLKIWYDPLDYLYNFSLNPNVNLILTHEHNITR